MALVDIGGQNIFVATRFLDRSPLLLLVHGAGGSHLDWPPQLRRSDHFGSCAVDLPGHGRSDKPGRSTISDYAGDVMQLIETLDLSNIVLVGHSMGGAIALDIALNHPARVKGLVLISTGARLKVNEELLDLVGSSYEDAVDLISEASWGSNAPADLIYRGSQLMLSCDPASIRMDFTACNRFDVMSLLDNIEIPTLILVGSEDRMTPPKYAQYLAEQIPQAQLVVIAGAGHMLALEQPERVRDAINDFIQRRLDTG